MAGSSTDTDATGSTVSAPQRSETAGRGVGRALFRLAVAAVCILTGFAATTQIQAGGGLDEQLDGQSEQELAAILSNLSARSDRLQNELSDLKLTRQALATSAESERLAAQNLQQRLASLRILAGGAAATGEGIVLVITDPGRTVSQTVLFDAVQELRDAGAEAIAFNDVRLVASSSVVVRDGQVVVDGQSVDPPFRIAAVGPASAMETALKFPGGVVERLQQLSAEVTTSIKSRAQLTVPAREDTSSFVYAQPQPSEGDT